MDTLILKWFLILLWWALVIGSAIFFLMFVFMVLSEAKGSGFFVGLITFILIVMSYTNVAKRMKE